VAIPTSLVAASPPPASASSDADRLPIGIDLDVTEALRSMQRVVDDTEPPPLWPPPRTASGSSWPGEAIAATAAPASVGRAITAGRRSIIAL
jgi:hypothetical protein